MEKFILVDDDSINNKLCTYIIKKVFGNSEIKCFEFPAEGLQFIKSAYGNLDVSERTILFLDINMPEINGWQFLDEFSKLEPHVQNQFIIYIVSSSIDPTDEEKANKHPFVKGYLPKPLNASVLADVKGS